MLLTIFNTQYHNALDCLFSGSEETIPFNKVGYCPIYDDLYEAIEADSCDSNFGGVVRDNIRALISNVNISDVCFQ